MSGHSWNPHLTPPGSARWVRSFPGPLFTWKMQVLTLGVVLKVPSLNPHEASDGSLQGEGQKVATGACSHLLTLGPVLPALE